MSNKSEEKLEERVNKYQKTNRPLISKQSFLSKAFNKHPKLWSIMISYKDLSLEEFEKIVLPIYNLRSLNVSFKGLNDTYFNIDFGFKKALKVSSTKKGDVNFTTIKNNIASIINDGPHAEIKEVGNTDYLNNKLDNISEYANLFMVTFSTGKGITYRAEYVKNNTRKHNDSGYYLRILREISYLRDRKGLKRTAEKIFSKIHAQDIFDKNVVHRKNDYCIASDIEQNLKDVNLLGLLHLYKSEGFKDVQILDSNNSRKLFSSKKKRLKDLSPSIFSSTNGRRLFSYSNGKVELNENFTKEEFLIFVNQLQETYSAVTINANYVGLFPKSYMQKIPAERVHSVDSPYFLINKVAQYMRWVTEHIKKD